MKALIVLFCITFASNQQEELRQFSSLVGIWKMKTANGVVYEEWRKLNESALTGKSYKVNKKDTMVLENILLQAIENAVYYIPTVENQNAKKPVKFKMTSASENKFTFENNEHDFPQRIIYRFVNNDSLVARIEGRVHGKERSEEFYYARAK